MIETLPFLEVEVSIALRLHLVGGEVMIDFDFSNCRSNICILEESYVCYSKKKFFSCKILKYMFLERVDLNKTSRRNMEVKLKKFEQRSDSMKVSKSFSSLKFESIQTKEWD